MKFDLSIVSSIYQQISSSNSNGWTLTCNETFLLIDQYPKLYLFDQEFNLLQDYSWKFGLILSMCWSSVRKSFLILTEKKKIYLINENFTSIEQIRTIREKNWSCLTCSNNSLFLSTNEKHTNLFQFNVFPSFQLIKQWKPPYSCEQNQFISYFTSNEQYLALIVISCSDRKVFFVVRSLTTLDLLWSIELHLNYKWFQTPIRCCSLNDNQWLVFEEYTAG
ncbi:hypothetical protein DMUE_6319, partial [Dictyocoela muelleri]